MESGNEVVNCEQTPFSRPHLISLHHTFTTVRPCTFCSRFFTWKAVMHDIMLGPLVPWSLGPLVPWSVVVRVSHCQ